MQELVIVTVKQCSVVHLPSAYKKYGVGIYKFNGICS